MKRIKFSILGAAAALPAASILIASAATNLVSNGDFASGVSGWEDMGGNPQPFFGGMALTNDYAGHGSSYYSASQCVTNVSPGASYTLSGDAIVPENAPAFGGARLIILFYDNDDCVGPSIASDSDSGGTKAAERGQMLKLSVTETAPAGATAVRVRPTAQKEPKAPANTAPGELVVAFDNITLTKKLVIGPAIPDLPIKDLDPGDEPPVDPDPEEEPADEPADEPVEEPADEPDAPADEPEAPADEPADDGSQDDAAGDSSESDDGAGAETPAPNQPTKGNDGKGSNKGTNQPLNGNGNAPGSATSAPLPPETGQGEGSSDRGTMIFGGSIAAVLAGLGLLAFALRSRRKAEVDAE